MCSVSIAACRNGQPAVGVVYDPEREELFEAVEGKGAWLNGEQLSVVAKLCAALPDLHVVLDHVAHVAIDAHWNYPPVDILKVAHRLEGLDLLWLEDPIPPENVAAMRELYQQTTLPICTGENFYTTHGFR